MNDGPDLRIMDSRHLLLWVIRSQPIELRGISVIYTSALVRCLQVLEEAAGYHCEPALFLSARALGFAPIAYLFPYVRGPIRRMRLCSIPFG